MLPRMAKRIFMASQLINKSQSQWSLLEDHPLMRRTDKQLEGQVKISVLYQDRFQGKQPESLMDYNSPEHRRCKINMEQADQIRKSYTPGEYGKKRLAKEFGVSKAVITRILNHQSWKIK